MQYSAYHAESQLWEASRSQEMSHGSSAPPAPAETTSRRVRASVSLTKRRLAARISAARDEERERIGRELHDALGANLTALQLAVAQLRQCCADGDGWRDVCGTLETLVAGAQEAASHIVHALHPPLLDAGLSMALRGWARQFARHTGLACEWRCDAPARAAADQLPLPAASMLYRIAQEALNNAAKHAHACCVMVSLSSTGQFIELTVRDNGTGFTAGAPRARRTFGVQGMQDRCISLGGTFSIDSTPGQGTTVRARLPRQAGLAASM